MEIKKSVRTYCLKQLISLVDVARNITGSRSTNDSFSVRFSSFHLRALLHLSSDSQTGSLIIYANKRVIG